MYLCDYINDLGIRYRRIKPNIMGINRLTNIVIPTIDVIVQLSNYVDTGGYYLVGNKEAVCTMRGKRRRLVLQKGNLYYELDYWQPFTELDWSVFADEDVAVEVTGEFIGSTDLDIILRS